MVDSQDWAVIYDERIEKQIDTDKIRSKEDLERELSNFFLSNKPRIYHQADGNFSVDYGHGERLRPHIKYIANQIWTSPKFSFGGIVGEEDFKADVKFKTRQKFQIRYNMKKDLFQYYRSGKIISKPKGVFIGKIRGAR